MVSFQQLINAWNQFFHAPEPYTTLGVFRILWGALLFINGLILIPDALRYFGPAGILSASRHQQIFGKSRFSLFQLLPDTNNSVILLLAVHLVSCAFVTIGWLTQWSIIVCWMTMVSFHHRNPCVFHSGDTVLRLLTFFMIFAPAGACYSVDHMLKANTVKLVKTDSQPTTSQGVLLPAQPPNIHEQTPETGSPWALRLMQIQVCVVYVRSVFWKLRGKRWWDGTAAYYPTQVDSFNRLHLPAWCMNRFCIASATYGTLLAELSLGTLIWIDELRYPVLFVGIVLHLMIELFLNLQLFGWTMVAAYVLFVPPDDMARLVALLHHFSV